MALAHYLEGRYDEGIEWATKAVHLMPQWHFGQFMLIATLVRADREDEAKSAVKSCYEALPDASVSHLDRMPLKDDAEMEQLRNCLRRAGLKD